MESLKMIMASRQADRNPFRELLDKMGVFGGPNLQEMGGVPAMPPRPANAMPQQGGQDIRKIVALLMSKGVPEDEAVAQAQKMSQQSRVFGGGN